MALEQLYPAAAPPIIGRGLIASSFQYYLTGTETLRVAVTPIYGVGTVELATRLWRESDRVVVLQRETISLGGIFPVAATKEYALDAGALLNVRIGVGDLVVPYALVWVRVQLIQGAGAGAPVIGTLAQGYVSTQNDLAWPGSPIEKQDQAAGFVLSIPGVLGGTASTWTVPAGERWRVISGRFIYLCGGVAGNRNPFVGVLDASTNYVYVGMSANAAGAGGTLIAAFAAGHSPAPDIGASQMHLSFPSDLELSAGWQVQVSAAGAQVGDGITQAILAIRKRVDG